MHIFTALTDNNPGDIMLVATIRAILLYILIIIAVRLMGKRQLGELQPSELVITILVSNIASIPIEDPGAPMLLSTIPIMTIVIFEVIISSLSLKSKGFRKILSGNPMIIIQNGTINQKTMKKLRFTIDDLMESLRASNIFRIEDVHYAIVETTGKISILQKFTAQTVTTEMMKINGNDLPVPNVIISDGRIVKEALQSCNLSEHWVNETLRKNHYQIIDVFLMTADITKKYYIVPKQKD